MTWNIIVCPFETIFTISKCLKAIWNGHKCNFFLNFRLFHCRVIFWGVYFFHLTFLEFSQFTSILNFPYQCVYSYQDLTSFLLFSHFYGPIFQRFFEECGKMRQFLSITWILYHWLQLFCKRKYSMIFNKFEFVSESKHNYYIFYFKKTIYISFIFLVDIFDYTVGQALLLDSKKNS